jgi:hypothetical protein
MCSLDIVWACYEEDEGLVGWKGLKRRVACKLSVKDASSSPANPNKVGRRSGTWLEGGKQ